MIHIENLIFSYTGTSPYVLNRINLEIKNGEYVSIVGDNGCGKSTLIRLLLKFIKPTSGRIHVQTANIGYVPQKKEFSDSHFPITVFEMLNSYRKILKMKNKECIYKALDQVNMTEFKDNLIGNLSGGQSQKILIARALMGNPELLILDEPSTGVDRKSQIEIYQLLKILNKKLGITILSVEHNLEAAISNSTLIYHLMAGHGHLCTPEQYAKEYSTQEKEDTYRVPL